MKTVAIFLAIPALLTHVMAIPVGPPADLNETATVLEGRESPSLDPRQCTFRDAHGTIPCDHFSVVFGDGSFEGGRRTITITGSNFKKSARLNCGNSEAFETFTSPLPFVVSIKGGNVCKGKQLGDAYDGAVSTYLHTLPILAAYLYT